MADQFHYKVLVCMDCGEEFVSTASAQAYFENKGLKYVPKRCRFCHIEAKKQQRTTEPDQATSDLGLRAG